jgi:hypothetical protein
MKVSYKANCIYGLIFTSDIVCHDIDSQEARKTYTFVWCLTVIFSVGTIYNKSYIY